jgi:hypothetical protein
MDDTIKGVRQCRCVDRLRAQPLGDTQDLTTMQSPPPSPFPVGAANRPARLGRPSARPLCSTGHRQAPLSGSALLFRIREDLNLGNLDTA